MSVEIYRSEEDESIVNDIYITEESDENIDMPEFANIKKIKTLKIEDITDFKKIQEMLNKIPLHLIEKLELSNCDFKDMDLEFFEKLENLNEIEIKFCSNIDYNEVIKRIPNKNLLKGIMIRNDEESENTFDVKLLEQFQELEVIGLRNIKSLDMEDLQSVLSIARNLSQFIFEGHIQSLNVIEGIDIEHIEITDYELDLSLITPEIAKAHRQIGFTTSQGRISIENTEDGQGYKLRLPLSSIIKTKEIKELIDGATSIEIEDVSNQVELQEIIENKKLLSKVTRIQELNITGIQDSKKFQQLLSSIPLEVIESLEIRECNMQGIESSVFKRLHGIKKVYLFRNKGINYNEILECIPNKEQIKNIMLEDTGNTVKCGNIQEYTGVTMMSLEGFQALDEGEIKEFLLRANNLKWFRSSVEFMSLDFLLIENELEEMELKTGDFDKKALTPEIAKRHKRIRILTPQGQIITSKQEDGENYELEIDLNLYKDIEQLKELMEGATKWNFVICEVDIYSTEDINRLIAKKEIINQAEGFSVKVSHIGILKPSDIQRLNEEFENLEGIIIADPEEERVSYSRQKYTVDEYRELQEKVNEIIGDIPSNLTELQKFMIIYQRLGRMISYDNELIREDDDSDKEYIKQNKDKGRNLINGLIKGKCVCAGYSDILYNCLNVAGIEACKIRGNRHVWNKVKLDGVWYNVDLTWDCKDITQHNARGLKYCLRSDEEFKDGHTQTEGKKVESSSDYPREEIVKAFRFAEEFDRVKYAEYEVISEEPSWFDKLKARAMILFGKRKMIAAESTVITPKQEGRTESEQRRRWQTTSGIVVPDSGQGVQGKGIDNEAVVTTKYTENPKEPKEPGDE